MSAWRIAEIIRREFGLDVVRWTGKVFFFSMPDGADASEMRKAIATRAAELESENNDESLRQPGILRIRQPPESLFLG